MHFEVLVEERSAEVALQRLLPKIFGSDHTFEIQDLRGKRNLLKKLPGRLKAYRRFIQRNHKLVVLVDQDKQDCLALKAQLEQAAREAGLATRSEPASDGHFVVLNRIAIEELEAWFFGDPEALRAVYPKLPPTLQEKEKYRSADQIADTAEALGALLRQAGYYSTRLPKVQVAQQVAEHMDPDRNRSPSFCQFRDALREMAATGPEM